MHILKKSFSSFAPAFIITFALVALVAQATTVGTKIVLDPSFSGSGSNQAVEADATFTASSGTYLGGVMGNVWGTSLNAEAEFAGLIGKFSGGSTGLGAGVIGEVGEDSTGADAAFLAILGGDSGALTAGAAYGVRYLNSTAGSKFDYGLDLYSAAIGSYQPVTYGTADIRLSTGLTIASGAGAPIVACTVGDLYIRTDPPDYGEILYICGVENDWVDVAI